MVCWRTAVYDSAARLFARTFWMHESAGDCDARAAFDEACRAVEQARRVHASGRQGRLLYCLDDPQHASNTPEDRSAPRAVGLPQLSYICNDDQQRVAVIEARARGQGSWMPTGDSTIHANSGGYL